MSFKKRGQVTAFIVIGVVLLIIVALYFALFKGNNIIGPGAGTVDVDSLPIYEHVKSCMQKSTFDLLRQTSLQGGYVDTQDFIAHIDPVNSEGIRIDEYTVVPYFFYFEDGIFTSKYKEIETLENEYENVLPYLIIECFDNFESFSDVYNIKYGTPEVNLDFKEKFVDIEMDMPTTIINNTTPITINAVT